jgi:hypothetical protein
MTKLEKPIPDDIIAGIVGGEPQDAMARLCGVDPYPFRHPLWAKGPL